MPLVERALLKDGTRYFVAALVEVNPVSAEMLDRIKRWVTRPERLGGDRAGRLAVRLVRGPVRDAHRATPIASSRSARSCSFHPFPAPAAQIAHGETWAIRERERERGYAGMSVQQPVRQYWPAGHTVSGSQGVSPSGHCPLPPLPPAPPVPMLHSGGNSVLPRQYSQVSQVFSHSGTFVHGLQRVGSVAVSSVQPGSPMRMVTEVPSLRVTSQQPKQSQPLGVSSRQKSMHFCDLRWTVHEVRVVGTVGVARVQGIALELPDAAVVALTAVAVEEAVLLAGVDVVAGDAGGEGALVVVERADALGVPRIDPAIAVVVDAVGALGAGGHATSAWPNAGRGGRARAHRPTLRLAPAARPARIGGTGVAARGPRGARARLLIRGATVRGDDPDQEEDGTRREMVAVHKTPPEIERSSPRTSGQNCPR